jgi:hypothetical protein
VPHVRPTCPGLPWGVHGPNMTGEALRTLCFTDATPAPDSSTSRSRRSLDDLTAPQGATPEFQQRVRILARGPDDSSATLDGSSHRCIACCCSDRYSSDRFLPPYVSPPISRSGQLCFRSFVVQLSRNYPCRRPQTPVPPQYRPSTFPRESAHCCPRLGKAEGDTLEEHGPVGVTWRILDG